MPTRTLYLCAAIIAAAILLHAALPRYTWEVRGRDVFRFDRWTGTSDGGQYNAQGQWRRIDALRAEQAATAAR